MVAVTVVDEHGSESLVVAWFGEFNEFSGFDEFNGFDSFDGFSGGFDVDMVVFRICPVVSPTGTSRFLDNYVRGDPSHDSGSSDLPYGVAHARHR
jgi:hypothetical protein